MKLANNVAIVTGSGTGTGASIARLFAKEGAAVTITGRRQEVLARMVDAISASGDQALAAPGSVTEEADVQRVSRAVIPPMVRQGGGAIVNIASVLGLKAVPGFSVHAYAVAKAGVVMLTKTIAVHYAQDKIRCNCIAPAIVETSLTASLTSDATVCAALEARHPLGRMGTPEDIARAAVYFASDESLWTTGSVLTVDGGVMAQ